MKPPIHLIFDFDGTLVDSFPIVIEKFNHLADVFNFRKVNIQEINFLKDFTSKEFIEYLRIPFEELPEIILQIREDIWSEILTLPPFLNIPETIEKLYKLKIHLGILTSNSMKNVIDWLEHHHLRHFFDFIHTEPSYLDKGLALKEILERDKISKSKAFYVGDETRDIDAAIACDISAIAVTWGFSSAQILARQNPNYIITKPDDLFNLFNILVAKEKTVITQEGMSKS